MISLKFRMINLYIKFYFNQSLAQSKATPLSFHFEGGSDSEFNLTLKIRYLSVLFAYLYTGQS